MITQALEKHKKGLALALLCMAQFMVVLDFSIVNIALPSMQRDLGLSTQNLQWIISAYSLTFGGFLLLGGRMGDLYGRRKLFIAGLFLFSVASLAGGLALSGVWLIITRGIQGLGAAFIAPTVLSLITTTFAEGPERNKAFGIVGAMASLGFAAGAILGGILTAGPGWRWVMFVNVPIGFVLLILTPLLLAESRVESEERHIDILGAVLVTTGLIALVYALAQGNTLGWTSYRTLGLLAVAVVLLTAFVFVELRTREPLVRLSIFKQRTIMGANLISFLAPGVFGSCIFILTLYMQKVLGYSAIQTGLGFLPLAFVILIFSNLTARLVSRIGVKRILIVGLSTTAVGLLLFLGLSAHGSYLSTILPGMLVIGLGMGPTFGTMVIAATDGVKDEEQGLAAGVFNTTQQVGSGLILAIITAVSAAQTALVLQGGGQMKSALVAGSVYALVGCAIFDMIAVVVAIVVIRGKKNVVLRIDDVIGEEEREVTGPLAR
jgi:EmrB/QacA subfamily drug resistance transporter